MSSHWCNSHWSKQAAHSIHETFTYVQLNYLLSWLWQRKSHKNIKAVHLLDFSPALNCSTDATGFNLKQQHDETKQHTVTSRFMWKQKLHLKADLGPDFEKPWCEIMMLSSFLFAVFQNIPTFSVGRIAAPLHRTGLAGFSEFCVCMCVSGALLPTCSQQGLVVVDVFGGKRWTHADRKRWQRQTRQQTSQQELQLDLLLVGWGRRSLASYQGLTWRWNHSICYLINGAI